MRRLALALCSCTLVACGSDSGSGDNPPPDGPTLAGEKFSVTWGPVTVQPGQEDTQCIWVRLGNTTEIKVNQMHNQLNAASHHLIVYKNDMDTTEQLTPVPCSPFTGALNTTGMIAPIAITQKSDDLIALPDRVAYTFAANQMIKLEMHYKNNGDEPREVQATVDFYAAEPGTIDHEASILFAGSPDIQILPGQTQTLHQFLTLPASLDLSSSKIFAITGHTHQLGTSVKVGYGPSPAGPMTEVYAPDPFLWDEPATTTYADGFSVPKGGGFDFQCSWMNTTAQTVEFGESTDEEMCFFWAYYYPSQGSKVCIHTDQYNGGADLCCPGDILCAFLEMEF